GPGVLRRSRLVDSFAPGRSVSQPARLARSLPIGSALAQRRSAFADASPRQESSKTAPTFRIPTSSPRKLIHEFPFAHPSGLPSMSSAPAISIVEDLEAALSQFSTIAADLKRH